MSVLSFKSMFILLTKYKANYFAFNSTTGNRVFNDVSILYITVVNTNDAVMV